jgi:hypothetical protein
MTARTNRLGMSMTRRVRLPRSRKIAEPIPVSAEPADIVQTDYGRWALGLHHDAPTFETHGFAEQVRLRQTRHQNLWLKQ